MLKLEIGVQRSNIAIKLKYFLLTNLIVDFHRKFNDTRNGVLQQFDGCVGTNY